MLYVLANIAKLHIVDAVCMGWCSQVIHVCVGLLLLCVLVVVAEYYMYVWGCCRFLNVFVWLLIWYVWANAGMFYMYMWGCCSLVIHVHVG